MTRIMKLPEVMQTTGLSKSSIYACASGGRFPKPIMIGPRAVGWQSTEITEWIAERAALRGGAK